MHINLSIVVPVYNVSAYLRAGLDSILNQADGRVEVIAVDDGSKDESGRILDEYADLVREDRAGGSNVGGPSFRVVHQENGGVSRARNRGLELAKGEWITFMDPDDAYVDGAIAWLMERLEKTSADMVVYGWHSTGDQCSLVELGDDCVASHDMGNRDDAVCAVKSIYPVAWNCCYRNEVIGSRRFVPGLIKSEDALFGFECLLNAQRLEVHDIKLYKYVQREDSCMHTLSEPRVRANIDTCELFLAAAEKFRWYGDIKDAIFRKIRINAIWEAVDLIRQFPKERQGELWKYYFDKLQPVFGTGYVPLLSRVWYRVAFGLRSRILVVWVLHKPYAFARGVLKNGVLGGLWRKLR